MLQEHKRDCHGEIKHMRLVKQERRYFDIEINAIMTYNKSHA